MNPTRRRLTRIALIAGVPSAAAGIALAARSSAPCRYRGTAPPAPLDDAAGLSPVRLALVLGSGGPRGFAHIGVLKVLIKAGLAPDLIVGSSMGAVVGALLAAGLTPDALQALSRSVSWQPWLGDLTWSRHGWFSGDWLQAQVNQLVGDRPIERLDIAFAAVATRLPDGLAVAFARGDTGAAVRASAALPGMLLPLQIGDAVYGDGDLAAPLPVRIARARNAARVVAVDVSADLASAPPVEQLPTDWMVRDISRRVMIDDQQALADLTIAVPLPYYAGASQAYRDMAIAAGEAAGARALPRLRALRLLD